MTQERDMTYMICEADSVKKLSDEVNLLLQKGWRVQGGVNVVCSHSTAIWWFYQAMVMPSRGKEFAEEELA